MNDTSTSLSGETAGKYDKHDNWSTDADYDIGDKVPFQLSATLPSNYDDYKSYKMVFHDDLQATVFTLNDDIKVYYSVDGTWANAVEAPAASYEITKSVSAGNAFSAITGKTEGTEDFYVTFSDLKGTTTGISALTSSSAIFVTYTAALASGAKVGSAGNWNTGYLEYSNNPNTAQEGNPGTDTENSPKKSVVAFTYQTVFTKTDAVTGDPLAGAVFSLYKKDLNAAASATKCTETGYTDYVLVGSAQTSATSTGKFGWSGLDDGDYVLVEDSAPGDYAGNEVSPIPFKISAEHSDTELKKLNDVAEGTIKINGFVEIAEANATTKGDNVTVDLDDGSLSGAIANSKDTTLPSTGGIGTTLFYLAGGVMVVGAGVVLVTKKRLGKED